MSHVITSDPPQALEAVQRTSPAAPPAAAAAPQRTRRGRPKGSAKVPPLPAEQAASPQARRTATILLEVLAGLRSTTDAARTLDVSPVRFYAIEARAIGGLIAACEPRPTGIQPAAREAHELERLREQTRRHSMELNQVRSVLRSTQRQLGVATPAAPVAKPSTDGKKSRKQRRPTVRALTVVRRLIRAEADASAAALLNPAISTAATDAATSTRVPGGG